MAKRSYRKKIIVSSVILVALFIAMFAYVYPLLDGKNQKIIDELNGEKAEYNNLQSEKKSFELGQRDLKQIQSRPYQPSDLFKTDKFLVEAVEQLEQGAREADVVFSLQVSGNSTGGSVAAKGPKTASNLIAVPYTMEVKGEFGAIVSFLERVEQMPFITHVEGVDFKVASNTSITALLRAQFFIRK